MSDELDQMRRILAVRETKRAAAQLALTAVAARAAQAAAYAEASRVNAIATREQAIVRIREDRNAILSGTFNVGAFAELRRTAEQENARCADADQRAADAAEEARQREIERAEAAQILLSLDARCTALKDKLRTLHAAVLNKRDERAAEEFSPPQDLQMTGNA